VQLEGRGAFSIRMREGTNGYLHAVRIVVVCVLVLVVFSGLVGCADPSDTEEAFTGSTSVIDEVDSRFIGETDFRDWATKNSSLAEAEEFLKVELRVPADTLGHELLQIYTLETYPNGEPVDRLNQAAIFDYGDYTVGFIVCGSAESAQAWVDGQVNDLAVETGLGRRTKVNGHSAVVRTRGTVPMKTDASGKVLRPGITYGSNVVSWARGEVYVSVSSTAVSGDDLLQVARSIDSD